MLIVHGNYFALPFKEICVNTNVLNSHHELITILEEIKFCFIARISTSSYFEGTLISVYDKNNLIIYNFTVLSQEHPR
jgi:hypothetical protein